MGDVRRMRNPNRLYEFYDKLRDIHITNVPDWRFGQLMSNFLTWVYNTKNTDIFFPEEDKMIQLLEEYFKRVN